MNANTIEPIVAFREAMQDAGINIRGDIIADGKIHRYYAEGDRRGSRNAWAVLHLDAKPAGAFGTMRAGGTKHTWTAKGAKPLTLAERKRLRKEMEEAKGRRAADEAKQHADAAARATAIWEAASDVEDHPYLRRKQIASYGLKTAAWVRNYGGDSDPGGVREHSVPNALLVPLRNARKEILSLQAIFPNGENPLKRDKDYLAGGEKRGCWFSIGQPTKVNGQIVVVLVEGYATGASVHAATGLGTVVVFDAGNLLAVGKTVRRLMPNALILFAADNDAWTKIGDKAVNVGVEKATEAAEAVKGKLVYPIFADTRSKPTDFNDLQVLEGAEMVKMQILDGLAGPVRGVESSEGPRADEPPPHTEIPEGPDHTDLMMLPDAFDEYLGASAPPTATAEREDDDDEEDSAVKPNGFRVLGFDREKIYCYHNKKKMIIAHPTYRWGGALLELAHPNWWEAHFPGDKSYNQKAALSWLIETAYSRGFYNPAAGSRGRGAWLDNGRIVYHFGQQLSVDGILMGVEQIKKSRFVYEQAEHLPLPADDPLSAKDGKMLYELASKFRWSRSASAVLILGYVALAPVCGALRWRPHIWITGGTGSGKSTILDQFVYHLLDGYAVYANGNSTEAGIRQTLLSDSLPLLFDETEQNNEREMNRMQGFLAYARQSSTETAARTLKGTVSGVALGYQARPMICLSSVQVHMKHQADQERISVLALRPKRETEDAAGEWADLSRQLGMLKADTRLPARMIRRSINLLPTTLQNIEIFAAAAAGCFGTQREGDQYGTLLAGAWSLVSNRLATQDEAVRMIQRYDWGEYLENQETEESTKALGALMSAHVRMAHGETVTVHELACRAAGSEMETLRNVTSKDAETVLRRHGMAIRHGSAGPADCALLVSYNSTELFKLLDGTPYSADLKGQLLRIPRAWRFEKTVTICGLARRCVAIPMSAVLHDDRPIVRPREPGEDDEVPF